MDLFDIFTDSEKAAREALPPADDSLTGQAHRAAAAFDDVAAKEARYRIERDRLMAEVDKQLADLKQDYDDAKTACATAKETLLQAMDEAKVESVEMTDRADIKIKVTAGRKKSITKKWLTEEFGKQQANSIWSKVPKGPDSRALVIPPRFEDEPSD